MRDHVFYGIVTMMVWCLFLVILFGAYLLFTHQSLSYFVDEETGGLGFVLFFLLWMFIWYKIGSHYRKVYIAQKEMYKKRFPGLGDKEIDACYRWECITKVSKVLMIVFATAVPWYVIGNVRGPLDAKDIVYIGLLMAATVIFATIYKYGRKTKVRQKHDM